MKRYPALRGTGSAERVRDLLDHLAKGGGVKLRRLALVACGIHVTLDSRGRECVPLRRAARFVGVWPQTIRAAIRSGRLPAEKAGHVGASGCPPPWLVPLENLMAYQVSPQRQAAGRTRGR